MTDELHEYFGSKPQSKQEVKPTKHQPQPPQTVHEYFGSTPAPQQKQNIKKPLDRPGQTLEDYFGTKNKPQESNKEPFKQSALDTYFGVDPKTSKKNEQKRKELEELEKPYYKAMSGYGHKSQEGRWEFFNDDPNQGYKFHLNVAPDSVHAVAEELKDLDVVHKYLRGGEVEDGKVFTVYSGSKKQTERIVRQVYERISRFLKIPVEGTGEVPFAPNIVGRFRGNTDEFRQYGDLGVSFLKHDEGDNPQESYDRADKRLREIYGDYYGGGITYFDPDASTRTNRTA